MVPDDPLANLRNKKPRPSRQPCWSAGEVAQILAAATADLRPVFTLLAETRMRFGELQWLTGDDVDLNLKNPEICIRAKDRWRPKTRDQRTIPVSLVAKEVLQSMPRKWRWVVTMPRSKAVPVEGRQWTERRLLGALKRVLKGLGLVGKLHTLRHYFVSDALLNGVPQPIAQEWAGHLDPTILEMYTHVNRKDSQAAMELLSEAKSNLQKPKETKDGKKPDSAQS
jgi:integrase